MKTKIPIKQIPLIADDPVFPSTRFQGSKLKIVDWIWDAVKDLVWYETVSYQDLDRRIAMSYN